MPDLPALDDERLAALLAALGRDRLLGLMNVLKADLAGLDADDPRLLRLVHRLRGSSGSLGLPALAAALLRLETAIVAGVPGIAQAIASLEPLRAAGLAAVLAAGHAVGARKQ